MNTFLGMDNMPVNGDNDEEAKVEHDQTSIINGLYKLLIARQRLPNKHEKAARLFAKGKRRVQGDLDIVS